LPKRLSQLQITEGDAARGTNSQVQVSTGEIGIEQVQVISLPESTLNEVIGANVPTTAAGKRFEIIDKSRVFVET